MCSPTAGKPVEICSITVQVISEFPGQGRKRWQSAAFRADPAGGRMPTVEAVALDRHPRVCRRPVNSSSSPAWDPCVRSSSRTTPASSRTAPASSSALAFDDGDHQTGII